MQRNIHGIQLYTTHQEFQEKDLNLHPLRLRPDLADIDREIALLKELTEYSTNLTIFGTNYGGYPAISLINIYTDISINPYEQETQLLIQNLQQHFLTDTIHIIKHESSSCYTDSILYVCPNIPVSSLYLCEYKIVICDPIQSNPADYHYLSWNNRGIYIIHELWNNFSTKFNYYIKNDIFIYDNLINLLIMVKDAGNEFKSILEQNLPYIDRWTILDTGSTDNTVNDIKQILQHKRGCLYQEPFINFRDSRNRLLDLAGNDCAFNIMLDDTYVLNGRLREFLTLARTDDVIDSYSIYIKTDVLYTSNRITKPAKKLRYIYTIHEIIEHNKTATIPIEYGFITDVSNPYMINRTLTRKQGDLILLQTELINNPHDSRIYYYIAETYLAMKDWDNAYKYYKLRSMANTGFDEEIHDSFYKMAFLGTVYLNHPWDESHQLYLKCYELNPSRAESLFMIGSYYAQCRLDELAYMYMKQAYTKSIPNTDNMNIKLDIYNKYLPTALLPLCYIQHDYDLGIQCTTTLINNKHNIDLANRWICIFNLLRKAVYPISRNKLILSTNKVVIFVIDGGWQPWNGCTLDEYGLGGSETFVIKFAEFIGQTYCTIIFCNCSEEIIHNNVRYININKYFEYIAKYRIDICFINRYIEYVPVTIKYSIPTYIVLHDLLRPEEIIPISPCVKGVLCISPWHTQYVQQIFSQFSSIIHTISYGIDRWSFPIIKSKQPLSFIYSSFPNRGLLQLLQMFPKITAKYPHAILNIFCNLDHPFVHKFYADEIEQIKLLLVNQSNVFNHGWVKPAILKTYWAQSHIWLYPCTYHETCCLTAYEAAISKTLIITNDLAALRDTVGDRGVIIQGDPRTAEWQDLALAQLFTIIDSNQDMSFLIERNYKWACTKDYAVVVPQFIQQFINALI